TERTSREAELELSLQKLELENRRVGAALESLRRQMDPERAQAELEEQKAQAVIRLANLMHAAESERATRDIEILRARRTVENDVTDGRIREQLVGRLREVAVAMPKPNELRAVSVNGDGAAAPLVGFLSGLLNVANGAL